MIDSDDENLGNLTKEQLAQAFADKAQAIADLFDEIGEIIHPLERVFNSWENSSGNYLTEDDLKSVSDKLAIVKKHLSSMDSILKKYNEPRKTQIVNRSGVENVIRKVDLLSKLVNNEIKDEGWFYGYQGEKATEFKMVQEAYKEFVSKVISFYSSVKKDGFEHPPVDDLTKNHPIKPKSSPSEQDESLIIGKMLRDGKINIGQAKLAALNENYRKILLQKMIH